MNLQIVFEILLIFKMKFDVFKVIQIFEQD